VGEHDAPEGTRGSGEPGWTAEGADGERRDSGLWLARHSLRLGLLRLLIPAKMVARAVSDVVSEGVVDREIATPEREVRTLSIAVTGRNADGETVTRWIHCDDWNGHSKDVKKGDRVRVKGFFRERRYDRDGETVTTRIFVIKDLAVERQAKPRTEVETGRRVGVPCRGWSDDGGPALGFSASVRVAVRPPQRQTAKKERVRGITLSDGSLVKVIDG
jgi:single-stranded DNA-binding protein